MTVEAMTIGRRLWSWVFGEPACAAVTLHRGPLERRGLWIAVGFGAEPVTGDGSRLALSDRVSPARALAIAEFVGSRRLPVDGWVVEGLEARPVHGARLARWIASVGFALRRGELVVRTGGMAPEAQARLAARLRQIYPRPVSDPSSKEVA